MTHTQKLLFLLFLIVESMTHAQEARVIKVPIIIENNLISVILAVQKTDTLLLYTDTGGKNYLYRSGLKKLGLKKSKSNLWSPEIAKIFRSSNIPLPFEKQLNFIKDPKASEDGMLGREWFARRAWLFDYESETLSLANFTQQETEAEEKIPLGFKKDSLGNHTDHLPRIEVFIDNDTLSFLFDTGAQAFLSDEAQAYFQCTEKVATSFINATYFEKWKAAHPDWMILKGGDQSFGKSADIIVAPHVQIGSRSIGPVAFTKREDFNFEIMSERFMDSEIVGAIGGNALSQLERFIIDYPNEMMSLID
ncbi:hypothetical protein O3Q51_15470 [Cryomorphaceae bacterium 1068]|nr:hypothetical protein [Cryomorphaceae bacterium 1068]